MLIRRAHERGISIADMEDMTVGMILDYLTTCNNEDYDAKNKKDKGVTRYATQDDINAF